YSPLTTYLPSRRLLLSTSSASPGLPLAPADKIWNLVPPPLKNRIGRSQPSNRHFTSAYTALASLGAKVPESNSIPRRPTVSAANRQTPDCWLGSESTTPPSIWV